MESRSKHSAAKRLLGLLLALIMVVGLLPATVSAAAADEPETVDLEITKVWDDGDNEDRPESIEIQIMGGKDVITVTLTADGIEDEGEDNANVWTGVVKVPMLESNQQYTVAESEIPDGYTSEVTGDAETGFTITNVKTTTITVIKVWDDGDSEDAEIPESITVQLLADGHEVSDQVVELSAENKWTGTFDSVPMYANGEAIEYDVEETDIPDGYTSTVEGDAETGFIITNTYNTTEITITKVWEDNGDQDDIRPDSVDIQIMVDGKTVEVVALSADEWTTVIEMPKLENNQQYTVAESKVPDGYTSTVEGDAETGFIITNTHTPEPITYKITYKLNGGVYNGSGADIVEDYSKGTVISIHEAPTCEGYIFLYWEGSTYQPGDKYAVLEDHVFTAQWMKEETPPETGDITRPECWLLVMLLSMIAVVLIAGNLRPQDEKRRRARR